MDPALKVLEPDRFAIAIERDDLAVEEDGMSEGVRRRAEAVRDLGELRRLLVAEARPEPRAGRRDRGQCTDTVVLGLVGERRRFQGSLGRGRQHRANGGRVVGPAIHAARVRFVLPRALDLRARADLAALRAPPAPAPWSDRRSRSIRSTTSACCGSTASVSFGSLPFIFALMIFIRFWRYSSVYWPGSHVSASCSTSVRAIWSSGLRTSEADGNLYSPMSTSSSAYRM